MKKYQINTAATMKPHNAKKWWIDSGIVRPLTVEAENITEALKKALAQGKNRATAHVTKKAISQ